MTTNLPRPTPRHEGRIARLIDDADAVPLEADGAPEAAPNVILILADDLSYTDLGFTGGTEARTPHLDRLAKRSVRFDQAYVNSPICAPSRAGLMTGRYPHRFGYVNYTGLPVQMEQHDVGVPTDERLMGQPFQEAGYRTGIVGKWHLGVNPRFRPLQRGFDEFFGHLGGGHDYFEWDQELGGPIWRDDEPVDGEGYLTNVFADEACAFVRRHHERPFFLFLSFNAVHTPLQVPDEYVQVFADVESGVRRRVLAMGHCMDEGIGRLLATLEELDLSEDTVVLFLNDNGSSLGAGGNGSLRNGKHRVYEGGIRVPMLLSWPGHLEPGVYSPMVSAMDVLPTLLSAAGLPPAEGIDGVDLLPYLRGEAEGQPHEILYWRLKHMNAVREADMKLFMSGDLKDPIKLELFDLAADPGETTNLADEQPELVRHLRERFMAWRTQMPKPLF